MSQDAQPRLSLLSLSVAAANAAPLAPASPVADSAARSTQVATTNTTKHRRLSSAGRSRRRLSDARDAATRPFPTSLQTASASLAALSLSSPTVSHRPVNGAQPMQVSTARGMFELEPGSADDASLLASPPQPHAHPVYGAKSGRKRGTIFTCESCSKVYRHPSCLIKHRWEHTPQWQEASKLVLSKHQQVQLLEAAAILSHLSPSSASLPEDRSLWPSFLSGGLVPPPVSVPSNDVRPTPTATALRPTFAPGVHTSHPISSSVPASTMMGSTDPRQHDYVIGRSGGITRVLGVPAGTHRESVLMPAPAQTTEVDALNLLALRSGSGTGSWGGPTPVSVPQSHSRAHAHAHSLSLSSVQAPRERERRRSNAYEYGSRYDVPSGHAHGGWSLPRSSVRSKSGSSGSGSGSESRSDDEREGEAEGVFGGVDVRVGVEDEMEDRVDRGTVYGPRMRVWKTEYADGDGVVCVHEDEDEREDVADGKGVRRVEQTWDGMEMEMEMD